MKRTSFIGARAALSLTAGLLLAGVAMPAAAVNCATGEPVSIIKGDPVRSAADFVQNQSGGWSPTQIQVDAQDGANGSKPNNGDYVWSQLSGPTVALTPTGNDKVKFNAPDVGSTGASLVIQLAVSCTRSGATVTATDTVTINITDAYSLNRAPSALASANPASVSDGATVTLIGSGSDPDNNPISFTWTQTDGPAVTLANPNAAITTFTAPNTSSSNGATLKFRLRVSDGSLSATSDVTVNVVWVNDPPVARLACPDSLLDLDEGQAFILDGSTSSDTEAGPLTYAWSGGPWTTLITPWDGTPTLSLGDITGNVANLTAPLLTQGQVGKFTYRLTVTDAGGLYTFKDCDIFVHDITKPVISVPDDIIAEATSPLGAIIGPDRYVVSAFDNVDGSLPYGPNYFTCAPPVGSWFELDKVTPVACVARDSAGNEQTAGFSISVVDTTGPKIDVPDSFAVEATEPAGAHADYIAKSFDLVDGEKDADCTPPSGSLFPLTGLGPTATTVTCDAKDAHDNIAETRTFSLVVHDTTPPSFDEESIPADQTVEATSKDGAVATFDLPTASDIVDLDNVVVTCEPPSGSTFPLGDTTVSCDAVDTRGNNTAEDALTATFKVTVQDTTPPTLIDVPGDQTLEAMSAAGAPFVYAPTAQDLVDGDVPVTCTATPLPLTPGVFPLGVTSVTCQASDTRGNSASASFTVTVVDTTAPALLLPSAITAEATGPNGAAVAFAVSATDTVDPSVTPVCSANSGDTFALGTTTVNCSATDDSGNTASGNFTITVVDTTGPEISPHGNLTATATGNSSAVVNYGPLTAYDLVDGAVPVTCAPPSGSSFPVGSTTVECHAYDSRGNESYRGFTVTVTYSFSGFFQPIDNPPTPNTVKAGSAVPVKFSLGGNQGLDIFQSTPASGVIACGATEGDAIEVTVTAGSSSLQYDPVTGQYIYVWKTDKTWVGQCRILQIRLKDGVTTRSALFKFK